MFKKSILELHLKDKLFFLLVAILAIGGIYFGAKAAISYLSGSIKGHEEKLSETNNQVSQIEKKYGPKLEKTLAEIQSTCKQLQNGLIGELNNLGKRKLFGFAIAISVMLCGSFVIQLVSFAIK